MIAKMISTRPGSHPLNKYHRFIILKQKKRLEESNKSHLYSSNPRNNKQSKPYDKLTIQEKRFLDVSKELELPKKNVASAIAADVELYTDYQEFLF